MILYKWIVCVWIITRGIWVLARILCVISDPVVHACMLNCFSCVQLCATLWTVAHQSPLSMDSSGKNTGVGCYALLQGIFLTQGLNSHLLLSAALAGRFFTTSATWEAEAQSYYKSFTWQASWGKAAISTPDLVHILCPRVSEGRYSQGLRFSSPLSWTCTYKEPHSWARFTQLETVSGQDFFLTLWVMGRSLGHFFLTTSPPPFLSFWSPGSKTGGTLFQALWSVRWSTHLLWSTSPFFLGKILNTGGVSAVFCLASYLYFLHTWLQEMLEDLTVTFILVYCSNWPIWLLATPLSIWKTYNNITDFWFDAHSVPDTVLNILNDCLIFLFKVYPCDKPEV